MPIKPENAKRYPADWKQIREEVLVRAGNKCEQCGVKNYALGGRTKSGLWLPAWPLEEKLLRLVWPEPGDEAMCGTKEHHEVCRVIRIVLTVAHLDHTPEHCDEENLRAWCQRCHLAYDQKHHMANANSTRRKGKALAELFP